CPLLAHSRYGWCHQVSPTTLPFIFNQIRGKAHLLPNEAKRSSLILTRQKFSPSSHSLRVLSNPMKSPKGMVAYICQPDKPIERLIAHKNRVSPGSLLPIS
ncbi:MAG TPA: hypothetical protein VJL87_03905, partial [Bdellovibrionota bacterium]|nr:hypothetical protein [Bdellovibrionota bacterium]